MASKRLAGSRGIFVRSMVLGVVLGGLLLCPQHFYKPVPPEHRSDKGVTNKNPTVEETADAENSVPTDDNKQGLFRERIEDAVRAGRPLVVHVIVALCDNKHQGIVPVPEQLGNGQDPGNNLYWGAMYGVRTFLTRNAGWKIVAELPDLPEEVLEKVVFHTTVRHSGREVDVYLVAEAWDGAAIESAIERFMWMAAGYRSETVKVRTTSGFEELRAGGSAHLAAYIGHNGLMDFSLSNPPRGPSSTWRPSAIVLACKSKPYFFERLKQVGGHSLLLTTGFMAPEAYTLDAAVRAWAAGSEPYQVRDRAAAAYHKYQKCGLEAAKRLFFTEWPVERRPDKQLVRHYVAGKRWRGRLKKILQCRPRLLRQGIDLPGIYNIIPSNTAF